jgi:hypothetical protein
MKLSWMFGSSMEARHLLYAYLSVWLIHGGYCVWIALQWMRTKRDPRTEITSTSESNEEL